MSPVERLALSRERLWAAMQPPATKPHGHVFSEGIAEFAKDLIDRLRTMPGIGSVIEPVEAWWAGHPLRTAGLIAAEASRNLATPMAQRHPLGDATWGYRRFGVAGPVSQA